MRRLLVAAVAAWAIVGVSGCTALLRDDWSIGPAPDGGDPQTGPNADGGSKTDADEGVAADAPAVSPGSPDASADASRSPDASPGCDGAASCAAACGDVQTSSQNCGSCGHDCLGGACTAGKCQPL